MAVESKYKSYYSQSCRDFLFYVNYIFAWDSWYLDGYGKFDILIGNKNSLPGSTVQNIYGLKKLNPQTKMQLPTTYTKFALDLLTSFSPNVDDRNFVKS